MLINEKTIEVTAKVKKPYKIDLELFGRALSSFGGIEYVQYDNNAYPLTMRLLEHEKPFNIPDGVAVEINIELPSGKRVSRAGRVVSPDSVAYDVNYDDLTQFGKHTVSVSLKLRNGTRLTWQFFTFYVRRALSDGTRPLACVICKTSDGEICQCADGILTVKGVVQ